MYLAQNNQDNDGCLKFEMIACQQMQEEKEACWQNLVQRLMHELAINQNKLQQTTEAYQQIQTEYQQLSEKLSESEAKNRALIEASVAQAQQFSQTLRQLRENQAQVVQSEKMASLGQLVAGVAHEINNPVNFIYGNLCHATEYAQDLMDLLQLYQQQYPTPTPEIAAKTEAMDLEFLSEDLPKLLLSMRVGAERIQKIVLALRNFSRMDEAEMKAVDIHAGIESTLMILQNRLKAKADHPEIRIVKEYSNLPLIECYAGQLNQVLMNILVNAIDALEEANTKPEANQTRAPFNQITIRTSLLDADWIQIAIADNGPGIAETVHQQIFDPFFTTKPVGKGTGLGMSISYQIITEKHGGKLKCFSKPGCGTEFVIQIPTRQQVSQLV